MDPAQMMACELDPSLVLDLLGFDALEWQRGLMRSPSSKVIINAHRQSGKSSVAAALALWMAISQPESLSIIVSASLRQSNELFLKVKGFHKSLGSPVPAVADNAVTLRLQNDSRIVSLPDAIDTIVGFSGPRLIILDEAARMKDETFLGLRPMLTRSQGRMVVMSTPRGRRGFFYACWHDDKTTWDRVAYPVSQNPHISKEWLEEEMRLLGPRSYQQEYELSFEADDDQYFPTEAILAAFGGDDRQPMDAGGLLE